MAGDAMVMPAERGGSQQWRGSRVSLERRAAPHERAFKGTAAAGGARRAGAGRPARCRKAPGGTTDPPSGGEPGRARVSGCLREADPTTGAAQEELLSGPSAFSPASFALPPPPSLGPRLHRTPAPQHAQVRERAAGKGLGTSWGWVYGEVPGPGVRAPPSRFSCPREGVRPGAPSPPPPGQPAARGSGRPGRRSGSRSSAESRDS